MKVERKEAEFQPVVITLESQFEVDVLKELLGSVSGKGCLREFVNSIYHAMDSYSPTDTEYFTGTVDIK